jgi:uncharacterized protein involved in cysteine biosynthesis
MISALTPLVRALAQLDDPAFRGVVWRSLVLAALCFASLLVGAMGAIHWLTGWSGWLASLADLITGVGTALLALWLFLPVAAAIGTLFIDRIAAAVERRWYPDLPPGRPATLAAQLWDGIAVGGRILLANLIAVPLLLLVPGIGVLLLWLIAAWAIGRGLFVAVAMRRMPRATAEAAYRDSRSLILVQGAALALAGYVPAFNLLIPVLGTAAMVHVLDSAMARSTTTR